MSLSSRIRERIPKRLGLLFGTASVTYVGMGLSLISAPLLASSLGADGRGVLAGAFVSIQLLSWVSFFGLPRGLAIQSSKRHEVSKSGIAFITVLGPVSAAFAFFSADLVTNGDERISLGIRIASVVLLFAGFSQLGTEGTLVRGQIWRFNWIRITNVVVPPLAYIVVFFFGHLTLPVAFSITLSAQVLATVLGTIFAVPTIKSLARVRVPWKFSFRYWSSSAFDSIGGRIDQLLLTAMTDAATLGVYAVAITCAAASGGLTQAINHLSYSRFAGSSADSALAALRRRSRHGVIFSLISGTVVVIAVAAIGPHVFGPSFDNLVPITAILAVVQLLNDQWQLRVYYDSAAEEGSSLALASAIGLGILVALAVGLELAGLLTGVTMALAALGFSFTRLGVRRILIARTTQKVPERRTT